MKIVSPYDIMNPIYNTSKRKLYLLKVFGKELRVVSPMREHYSVYYKFFGKFYFAGIIDRPFIFNKPEPFFTFSEICNPEKYERTRN